MKSVKITESNIGTIDSIIRQVEGRASVRTIDADIVLKTANNITEKLSIPKKAMIGISVHADPNAQHFPNAYKFIPESTQFSMEYRAGGWYLTSVERKATKAPTKAYSLILSETAEKAIISRHQNLGVYDI